ncbi:Predicted ATP-dependent carboligase, ATP-grasp superfamily [Methylomagnum ishizawai]|uniref:Predicted ATP-dependent carboligase, ATP-grasp superfamily n=1 Tax=Methylomagnum ishizawai TaxID=1760988 RepID=A0A1Y6D3G1_9GAMM|nr:ATP-grasp domain-containing protein [Methylomagnum ishizawai]SMF97141.1 Predicted ATP-dependent carboligase, ATP-grasp superfamily [Methylomagnum ishizawai]
MRILVFEYVTGGGLAPEIPPASLVVEGEFMLMALLRDLSGLPGVDILALRDARLPPPSGNFPRTEWIALDTGGDAERRFGELAAGCDAVWPIAPETGGILERLCRTVETLGKPLLTSPAAAVGIAASKFATARHLETHGIPVVKTLPLDAWPDPMFPMVVKPDDGVGCEGSRIVATPEAWRHCLERFAGQGYVAQPLIAGEALSLSALFAQGEAIALSLNRQHIIRRDGGFVLTGCGVNAVDAATATACGTLAPAIAATLPELWGYAGVDFILTPQGPRVLEINPRLTTSYTGLARALGVNPAGLILDLWRHGRLPDPARLDRVPVEITLEPEHEH